jgi:tetratricopeptide (TPR) repeat protein
VTGSRQAPRAATQRRRLWIAIACALVVAATIIAFLPSLGNNFVNWDDEEYVTGSTLVTGLSTEHLERIVTEPVKANYHPLTILTLAVDYRLWDLDPFGYHATNLALHVLNTLLVFVLVLRLGGGRLPAAVITALFFGIHPMHVESVAWISARKDVLYALLFLSALIAYTRFVQQDMRRYYWIAAGLFVLSVLSKPMAVVFPVVLILIDYWLGRRPCKVVFVEKIPLFALSLVFGIVALQTQAHAMGDVARYTLTERLAFASYGIVAYLVKLLAPVKLSALYPYPRGEIPGAFLLAPVIVLGILFAILWCVRRSKLVMFGMAFYFVNIALVLQFVSVGQAIMADRYSYLAYFGPLFIIGVLYGKAADRATAGLKFVLAAGLCICAVLCIYLTFERCKVWENSEVLWTDVLKKHPESHVAHYNRGVYYRSRGNDDKALDDFDRALSLKSNYARAYNNRGAIRYRRGQNKLALEDFDRAIESSPDFAEAYFNRGRVHMAERADDLALRDYTLAVQLDPDLAAAYNNRASIYFKRGQFEQALEDFDRAVRLEPDNAGYRLNRSYCLDALGQTAMAYEDALRARQLGAEVDAQYLRRLERAQR